MKNTANKDNNGTNVECGFFCKHGALLTLHFFLLLAFILSFSDVLHAVLIFQSYHLWFILGLGALLAFNIKPILKKENSLLLIAFLMIFIIFLTGPSLGSNLLGVHLIEEGCEKGFSSHVEQQLNARNITSQEACNIIDSYK